MKLIELNELGHAGFGHFPAGNVASWNDPLTHHVGRNAEQVGQQRIHILFELSGHTRGYGLMAFARKPAPIEVLAGGFFDTTGVDAMEYVISDGVETPAGAESGFTEKIVRMPDGYVSYDPPHYAPDVAPLPAAASGRITFGCFNNLSKINDQVVDFWCRLLHRLD